MHIQCFTELCIRNPFQCKEIGETQHPKSNLTVFFLSEVFTCLLNTSLGVQGNQSFHTCDKGCMPVFMTALTQVDLF